MTSPQYATRGPGGRYYEIPSPPLQRPFRGPSVTTILGKGMPAPALKSWGERTVAEFAVDNIDSWRDLDRDAAIDLVKRAPYRSMTSAGDAGTDVHALCEQIMRGRDIGDMENMYPEHLGNFRHWLKEWDVEPLMLERTVVNTDAYRPYAGSFDFVARIDGEVWLGDIKTSKGVYPKTGLQLAAYASANVVLSADGRSLDKFPKIDRLGILHLRDDRADWYPIGEVTDVLFDAFNAVYDVAMFEIDGSRSVMGRKPADPPQRDEYRAELRERVAAVIEWGGAAELAEKWPQDIPTLKHDGHTTHQLDAIEYLLRRIEPTWRPKPTPASREAHDAAIATLAGLTPETLATVEKYANVALVPNLRTYQATDEQLAQLDRIVVAVCRAPDPEDRAARIGRATKGRTTSPAGLTADDMPAFSRTRKSKANSQNQLEGANT